MAVDNACWDSVVDKAAKVVGGEVVCWIVQAVSVMVSKLMTGIFTVINIGVLLRFMLALF